MATQMFALQTPCCPASRFDHHHHPTNIDGRPPACRPSRRRTFRAPPPCSSSSRDEVPPSDESSMKSQEESIKDRILKAKLYRDSKSSGAVSTSGSAGDDDNYDDGGRPQEGSGSGELGQGGLGAAPTPIRVAPEPERPEFSERRLSQEEFQARLNPAAAPIGEPSKSSSSSSKPSFRGVAASQQEGSNAAKELKRVESTLGSASETAGFLENVFAGEKAELVADIKKENPDMRPEAFTEAREQRVRAMGADVISVDKSYKPTVSTWGLYPRPDNISKTYGGGKTIDPSKPLEEDSVKAKRDQEIMDRLATYRKGVGLDIDAEVEREFKGVFDRGMVLFEAGELVAAYRKFDSASELVEWKTKVGGEAAYQKALCLDSLGKSMEAKPMYNQLTQHPNPDVRKLAKRMLFGFQAMDNLKTHTISYSAGNTYQEYFRRLSSDWNNTYFGEDENEMDPTSIIFLVSMILLPLVLVVVLMQK